MTNTYQKAWRAANKERVKSYCLKWRLKNRERERQRYHDETEEQREKRRERGRQRYAEQIEKKRAQALGYYWKNVEKNRARGRAYNAKNRDRLHVAYKEWAVKNRGLRQASIKRRQLAKIRAVPAWADHVKIKEIYIEAASKGLRRNIHVDHYVPIQSDVVCGFHVAENLRITTAAENMAKRNFWRDDIRDAGEVDYMAWLISKGLAAKESITR